MALVFGGTLSCVVYLAHKPDPRPPGPFMLPPQIAAPQAPESGPPDAAVGLSMGTAILEPAGADYAPPALDPFDAGTLPDLVR